MTYIQEFWQLSSASQFPFIGRQTLDGLSDARDQLGTAYVTLELHSPPHSFLTYDIKQKAENQKKKLKVGRITIPMAHKKINHTTFSLHWFLLSFWFKTFYPHVPQVCAGVPPEAREPGAALLHRRHRRQARAGPAQVDISSRYLACCPQLSCTLNKALHGLLGKASLVSIVEGYRNMCVPSVTGQRRCYETEL